MNRPVMPLEIPFGTADWEGNQAGDVADAEEAQIFAASPDDNRQAPEFVTNPATPKQIDFLLDLSTKRDWAGMGGHEGETIMDAIDGKAVSKREASAAITALMKIRPKLTEQRAGSMATRAEEIPAGKYALDYTNGAVRFYRVSYGKVGGRWEGRTFVVGLRGAPGRYEEVSALQADM